MKILFTGASSFTGMHFVQALAEAGHQIAAVFPRPRDEYEGVRRARVERILSHSDPYFEAPFGSSRFLRIIRENGPWDVLCHHAAEVQNYKDPNFDYIRALSRNTYRLQEVLESINCKKIVLTGSIFEPNEGAGDLPLRAFSPYGLSKGITFSTFQYFCRNSGIPLAKFVIPNPFGPFEENRFTSYLVRTWMKKEKAEIHSPDYVRDNIPVTLLALDYVRFLESGSLKQSPSFYAESQAKFTERLANEMRPRLNLPCEYILKKQIDFSEPTVRINTNPIPFQELGWSKKTFWDSLAEHYQTIPA